MAPPHPPPPRRASTPAPPVGYSVGMSSISVIALARDLAIIVAAVVFVVDIV